MKNPKYFFGFAGCTFRYEGGTKQQKPEGDKGRMNNMEKNERFSEKAHEALPLVLTVPEAAKQLRVGIGRCDELVRCGRLRSVKIGKRFLIPKSAILDFLGMADMTEETLA